MGSGVRVTAMSKEPRKPGKGVSTIGLELFPLVEDRLVECSGAVGKGGGSVSGEGRQSGESVMRVQEGDYVALKRPRWGGDGGSKILDRGVRKPGWRARPRGGGSSGSLWIATGKSSGARNRRGKRLAKKFSEANNEKNGGVTVSGKGEGLADQKRLCKEGGGLV